jgi:ADP-heptose:LPS heptosyltransferase
MIRSQWPKTFIAAAVSRGIGEMLAPYNLVDETIDLGAIPPSGSGAIAKAKQFAKLASSLRKMDSDLVLDFSPRGELQFLARFLLQTRTVVPATGNFTNILGRKGKRAGDFKSGYASVLRQIGIEASRLDLKIELTAEDNQRFEKLLEKSGSRGGEPLVVIHSEMGRDRACWPAEQFADVSTRLSSNLGARIIALDEPTDRRFTESVFSSLPRGSIKLSSPRAIDLFAAVARASLLLTDNRGLAWAATEMGVPTLELAESRSGVSSEAKTHRVAASSSLMRLSADEVYSQACELLMENRSSLLFHR